MDDDGLPDEPATAILRFSIHFPFLLINNFFTLSKKATKMKCQQGKEGFFSRW